MSQLPIGVRNNQKVIDPRHTQITDPRTEAIMWTCVVPPIIYGTSRSLFNFSKGVSIFNALVTGVLIWNGIPHFAKAAYSQLANMAQTDFKPANKEYLPPKPL